MTLNIVADSNIPLVAEAFREVGNVTLIPGRDISREQLLDCNALLVRTVTGVNRELLEGTRVEFVGTATIGTDHIDERYLADRKIAFSNAAGCNAEAASEYVISGLFELSRTKGFNPFQLKAGIIGCGNVGSRVYQKLTALGIDCLCNDPPLAAGNTGKEYVELQTIIEQCNFITLHVPLTTTGEHATKYLLNESNLDQLQQGCLLVNAARGPVIDNQALLAVIKKRPDLMVFLDTWEHEPTPLVELLQRVDLATPHIAGYSVEGRLRGTQMILDAACAHFGKTSGWHMSALLPDSIDLEIESGNDPLVYWQNVFRRHHDIQRDHQALLQLLELDENKRGAYFDSLRRVYPDRFEYPRYRLSCEQKEAAAIARALLFDVV
jgi:erythronate-4-phosphate dehydrogenase